MVFTRRSLLKLFRFLWFLAAVLGALFTLVRESALILFDVCLS